MHAFLVATMMTVGAATVEAAGKKPTGTVCDYLEAIINRPNTSPYILAWALSLYSHFGCDATD